MNIQRRPHSMRLIRTEGFHFTWAQEERQMLVLSLSCLRTIFIKTFLRLVYSREIPFSFLVVLCYDSLINFWWYFVFVDRRYLNRRLIRIHMKVILTAIIRLQGELKMEGTLLFMQLESSLQLVITWMWRISKNHM